MKTSRQFWMATGLSIALIASGCGGGSDGNIATAGSGSGSGSGNAVSVPAGGGNGSATTTTGTTGTTGTGNAVASIPEDASGSVVTFLAFLLSMNPNDETSDAATISEAFKVQDDEVNDPKPVT